MGLGILAIAKGAVTIGQKLFSGIKKRREARIEKRATALMNKRDALAEASAFFTPGIVNDQDAFGSLKSLINGQGAQTLSSAADTLANLKGYADTEPTAANVALQNRVGDVNKVNPMLLIGGAIILILLWLSGAFRRRR